MSDNLQDLKAPVAYARTEQFKAETAARILAALVESGSPDHTRADLLATYAVRYTNALISKLT